MNTDLKQKLIYVSTSFDYSNIIERYLNEGWIISTISGSNGDYSAAAGCWVLLSKDN